MSDAIIAIIWVVFMIIAAISAIARKAKQQQERQARESTDEGAAVKSRPVYTAPEEDIRDFLEQIGAKPEPAPMPVESLAPERPRHRKKPRVPVLKEVWPRDMEVPVVPEATTVDDPVAALTERLSPIQRAVVWREILDSPPGLRAGPFAREA